MREWVYVSAAERDGGRESERVRERGEREEEEEEVEREGYRSFVPVCH
jgi:hypothetical protein